MNFPFLDPHLKMLASPRSSHSLKLAAIVLSLFFTAYYLFNGHASADPSDSRYKDIYRTAISGKKAVFIERFLSTEIDGPFDNSTLVSLCKNTRWTPGLIFSCESPEGGIGNVRNAVLNCVRYAIEAGATGFVIPEILIQTSRAETSTPVPLTHFFDTAHFTSTLSTTCPQIRFYNHINDLYDLPSTAKAVPLTASSLTRSFVADSVLATPEEWSASFRTFLNQTHPTPFSASAPILVTLKKALLEFPLSYDDPRFVATFPRVLRFREDTRRLAGAILFALSSKYTLGLKPQASSQTNKFFGAHLRTGADAVAAGWTSYEMQAANYLLSAHNLRLPVIYLVSGSLDDISSFNQQAANMSLQVAHKELLLGGPDGRGAKGFEREWRELKTLSWDQRLLVDYEVLLRASSFGGTWESTYSWNIAMRRHVLVGGGSWTKAEAAPVTSPQPLTGTQPPNNLEHPAAFPHISLEDEGELDPLTLEPIANRPGGTTGMSRRRALNADQSQGKKRLRTPTVKRAGLVEARELQVSQAQPVSKHTTKTFATQIGDTTFRDALSAVYGPVGEGQRIMLSMWP